jgi:hypothetical protein
VARSMNQGPKKKSAPTLASSEELYGFMDPSTQMYGIGLNDREMSDFRKLLGTYEKGELKGREVNPFQGLPVSTAGSTYEAIAIYQDDDESEYLSEDLTAGDYYEPYYYPNYADEARDDYDAPAPLSVVPTSTTNYQRPRTVAAGYDKSRGTLTVVFRDGLFYNYYEVTPSEWNAFKSRTCKGCYIREVLDAKPRGSADIGGFAPIARETLYRVVRTTQIYFQGKQSAMDESRLYRSQRNAQAKKKPSTKASKPNRSALKSSKGNRKRSR